MSTTYPHLARAPITEALLDIQVEMPGELPLQAIDAFADRVRDAFPDGRLIEQAEVDISNTAQLATKKRVLGKIFWSPDKTRAVQARVNGFTVNHVRSYETWDALFTQARSLWSHFADVARPLRITRCALRYINRIAIPPHTDMKSFLRTMPVVSDGLPQLLEDFFMRLVIPFGGGRSAIVTQTTEGMPRGNDFPDLLFDIDTFSDNTFDPASDDFWDEFQRLRDIKNKCFFESMSRDMWEAYR